MMSASRMSRRSRGGGWTARWAAQRPSARYVPVKTVLPAAAKEAIRVPQNLRANERIGICAHHNGPRLPTWGPTDNISFRRIARHMTVMLGVGFGYPCSTYVPCLFAFRASADEETEMPRAQTSNPRMTDGLLLLAMIMEFLR